MLFQTDSNLFIMAQFKLVQTCSKKLKLHKTVSNWFKKNKKNSFNLRNQFFASFKKFKLYQNHSNWFKLVQTISNVSKQLKLVWIVQTNLDWFRLVTCSNWFKLVTTEANSTKLVQVGSMWQILYLVISGWNLFKVAQTGLTGASNFIPVRQG